MNVSTQAPAPDLGSAISIATEHRRALMELGWACGEIEIVADGAQFSVEQPYRVVGTGRRARTYPAQSQTRHIDRVGTMTLTRREVKE